jgi:hypothetical protein
VLPGRSQGCMCREARRYGFTPQREDEVRSLTCRRSRQSHDKWHEAAQCCRDDPRSARWYSQKRKSTTCGEDRTNALKGCLVRYCSWRLSTTTDRSQGFRLNERWTLPIRRRLRISSIPSLFTTLAGCSIIPPTRAGQVQWSLQLRDAG